MKKVDLVLQDFRIITPYFTVKEADEFICFLEEAFAAQVGYCEHRVDGTIDSALILLQDTLVEISDANARHPARSIFMHLQVQDVEAHFIRMVAAGARPVTEPSHQPNGASDSLLLDPWNNHWHLTTWE
ncbi:VOC family protein [Telluribacter sp.]|jgi:PhnB protein|uniref:VOC family protein n=1 Tax=Telluribacter sp. TaxID=1978767 RepID=UPI002E1042AD|nr:VOC family protein [Telluribacter sp.]